MKERKKKRVRLLTRAVEGCPVVILLWLFHAPFFGDLHDQEHHEGDDDEGYQCY